MEEIYMSFEDFQQRVNNIAQKLGCTVQKLFAELHNSAKCKGEIPTIEEVYQAIVELKAKERILTA